MPASLPLTSDPAELWEASQAVASARRLQPRLNAFVDIVEPATSRAAGSLAGLPYAAKDMLAARGRAATWGLAHAPGPAAATDAMILHVLDGAGAVRIGFTRMTELAYQPSGLSGSQPSPVNPWDPDAITGGSSSGSAVAVSAGIVPLAIGSDTAGSLRIPAQCCGVSAWKPTPGLIPLDGAMPLARSLDVLGFLAGDATLLGRVAALFAPKPALQIGRVAIADDLTAEAAIVSALDAMASALTRTGCTLARRSVSALIEACDGPLFTILQAEAAASHRALLSAGALGPVLTRRLAKGLEITADEVGAARDRIAGLRRDGPEILFGNADALLLPVMRDCTPDVSDVTPNSPTFRARTLYELSALTRFVNVLGLSAVALPAGFDCRGRPVAAQIVARAGDDRALIDLAAAVQACTDWHRREPPSVRLEPAGARP